MAKPKQPKIAVEPSGNKTPKFAKDPSVKGGPLTWRFSHADKDGPFAWSALADADEHKKIIERLAALETMEENDLRESGCHPIELHQLSKDAQDRLSQIRHDDLDSLYSLRIDGKTRIFCIHHGSIMRVLWYDPNHLVCPSVKKHT